MSDLVERLRATYLTASFNALNGCQDCGIAANDASQAADEITRLTRLATRVTELEGALRQIAGIDPWDDAEQGYVDKARAVLTQSTPEKGGE